MAKREIEKAAELFEDFNGRSPEYVDKVNVKEYDTAIEIGPCLQIAYLADDGKAYRHEFHPRSRPVLAVSADGKQLILIGGNYRFTGRGIVDIKR
jgi:hypothetical protein